jgi:hypothetical protein
VNCGPVVGLLAQEERREGAGLLHLERTISSTDAKLDASTVARCDGSTM